MSDLLENVARYGALLVFLNVFIEQLGFPIPAVPTLVLAGALVADGRLFGPGVLAAAVLASLIADGLWFALGRRHGRTILRFLCRLSLSPDSCVRETEERFDRWGERSLVIAKFVPGYSTVAPPLAGVARTSLGRFLVLTGLGAALWSGSALVVGVLFHRTVDRVLGAMAGLGTAAAYVLGGGLALYVGARWWRRHLFVRRLRMARIHPEELYRKMQDGSNPIVIDVRGDGSRRRDPRRLPGSIVMLSPEFDARIAGLAGTEEIVLYCT